MAKHNPILAAHGQNKIYQRSDFFLERNPFVTGNLIRSCRLFAEAVSKGSRICEVSGVAGRTRFAVLAKNCVSRFCDERRKVSADTVSNAQHQFQCRIAKAALDEAQHRFGDARTLRDGVIGKFPTLALLSQEPDDFVANGFVVADTRHAAAWQGKRFDIYFAIVKNRRWLEPGLPGENRTEGNV